MYEYVKCCRFLKSKETGPFLDHSYHSSTTKVRLKWVRLKTWYPNLWGLCIIVPQDNLLFDASMSPMFGPTYDNQIYYVLDNHMLYFMTHIWYNNHITCVWMFWVIYTIDHNQPELAGKSSWDRFFSDFRSGKLSVSLVNQQLEVS